MSLSSARSYRKCPPGCASLLQPKKPFFALKQFAVCMHPYDSLSEEIFKNYIECDVKSIAYIVQSDISYKEMENDQLEKKHGG